jgi:hypothetical protein
MQENWTLKDVLTKTQQGAEAMTNVINSIRQTEAISDASAGQLLAVLDHDKEVVRGALFSDHKASARHVKDVLSRGARNHAGADSSSASQRLRFKDTVLSNH